MKAWSKYPVIYEINTWVWLGELSRKHRKPVTLATVPDQEWEALAAITGSASTRAMMMVMMDEDILRDGVFWDSSQIAIVDKCHKVRSDADDPALIRCRMRSACPVVASANTSPIPSC